MIWKAIPGWEGYYEASDRGEIRGVSRVVTVNVASGSFDRLILGRTLRTYVGNSGYKEIKLRKDGERFGAFVHRLIAKTFLKGFIDDMQVNHLDGNKMNNAPSNLQGCTQHENVQHAFANGLHSGLGETHYKAKAVRDDKTGEVFGSATEAAKARGMKVGTLNAMLTGRHRSFTTLNYID